MGTGAQPPFPTEVGAPRLPITAQQTVTAPTAVAAGGSPPVSRRNWVAYAGGAFVVALGLIVGAALLLRDGGGTAAPAASNTLASDVRPTYEPTPEPTWNATPLAGVTLPPLRDPVHADEPAARVMEERIWDYVGPGWTLAVNSNDFAVEPRDPNAFQALYLVSPEREVFFLYPLRTDVHLGINHWDPIERVAWMMRWVSDDSWQTVELDLVPGDTTEKWVSEDLIPSTGDGVGYLATMDDGTEVFAQMEYKWVPQRLLIRPPGGPATMLAAIPGASYDDYETSDDDVFVERDVDIWFDTAGKVASIRVTTTTDDWATSDPPSWYTHDLTTDTLTPFTVSPQLPPTEMGMCWSAQTSFDGYLVVNCFQGRGDDYWLIDPTGAEPALQYTGAIPSPPAKSKEILDGAELGLTWEDGWWSPPVTALP